VVWQRGAVVKNEIGIPGESPKYSKAKKNGRNEEGNDVTEDVEKKVRNPPASKLDVRRTGKRKDEKKKKRVRLNKQSRFRSLPTDTQQDKSPQQTTLYNRGKAAIRSWQYGGKEGLKKSLSEKRR